MEFKEVTKTDPNDRLFDLPFDQYSRQRIVADTINQLRKNKKELTILDVGGYKGKTKDFMPNDKVTILDVYDVNDKGYIRGDGTKLEISDGAYDFTVSFDVLEHIAPKDRQKFIAECVRVSKKGFFMCCPFDSGSGINTKAEVDLNNIYTKISGKNHKWLGEHIANSLPMPSTIEDFIENGRLYQTKAFSNSLENWIAIQMIYFLSDSLKVVSMEAGKLNKQYNASMYDFESGQTIDTSYRVIYFISSNSDLVSQVEKILNNNLKPKNELKSSLSLSLPDALTEIISKKIEADNKTIELLNNELQGLHTEIKNIRSSLSWKVTKPLRSIKVAMCNRKK
jgi:hypothetical protein